jgi:hypothetical protein
MKNRFFIALRMTKRLDSCPFGFAQGRPFGGMTTGDGRRNDRPVSACATSCTPYGSNSGRHL